jgi:hypothetical protein
MKSAWFLGFLLCLVSGSISGDKTLYPGYVVNFKTPKNKDDGHYIYFPLTGLDDPTTPVNLLMKLAIDTKSSPSPLAKVYMNARTLPTGGTPIFDDFPSDTTTYPNASNNVFWITNTADCTNAVYPTCYETVEAEVGALTVLPSDVFAHWPPYAMLNQRRTAKMDIKAGTWLYFWLLVTDTVLTKDGTFGLYMGVQFWSDGEDSTVQMSVYNWVKNWPSGSDNSSLANARDYYPRSRSQKDDWIQPSPTPLEVGIYKVGAQAIGQKAQFTVKVGFNEPPKQAANLSVSFHRLGLLALISMCILANMKRLF